LCAGGDGDFWGEKQSLTTEGTENHRGNADWLLMIPVSESAAGVSFAVRVQPRAKKNAIVGELGDALKITLTAPPVEGRANGACIEFFANLLEVPRSSVSIASGESGRRKVIRVAGLSAGELRKRLGRWQR
jgi:uncharacterized protein (TIGR00251 family)